jgi:hypothetical protein
MMGPGAEAAAAPEESRAPTAPEVFSVATPDAGWRVRIERIVEFDSEVWILAQLSRPPGPAAQVIQQAKVTLPVALPVKSRRVLVAGKTWSWKNNEPYEFVPTLAPWLKRAGSARVLYAAPPPPPPRAARDR